MKKFTVFDCSGDIPVSEIQKREQAETTVDWMNNEIISSRLNWLPYEMTNAKIVNFQQLTIVKKITILPEEAKMVAYRATTTFFFE